MLQLIANETGQKVDDWMTNMCNYLFETWSVELSYEEKEIWLWNALVEMANIIQRRKT